MMKTFPIALALLGGALGAAALAGAQEPPAPVLPEGTRSVETRRGVVVRQQPQEDAELRGRVRSRTRMPALRAIRTSDDCGYWVNVGATAWVCGSDVRPSTEAPGGRPFPHVRPNRWLPHSYLVVPRDGVDAYASPEAAAARTPTERLAGGFMRRIYFSGDELYRTRDGLFVYREEVRRLWGSQFQGAELNGEVRLGELGWVVERRLRSERQPGVRRARYRRLTQVRVTGSPEEGVLQLDDGHRVRASAIRRPVPATPPTGITENERWIDVDVGRQTMVVYEGARPTYATLVSTGRGSRDHRTPLGEFRIWVKVGETTMDDFGNANESDNYSVEAVPWVQYFSGSVGFHAAYWHRAFGRRMSHGCVNLAPKDARYLYGVTSPVVPDGWMAVHPVEAELGTRVVVRNSLAR